MTVNGLIEKLKQTAEGAGVLVLLDRITKKVKREKMG